MKFNLSSEYQFRRLWYFTSFIYGVALYFGLSKEPDYILCAVLSTILIILAYWRKNIRFKLLCFFVLGLSVATLRTHFIHTEFMWKPQWNKEITGDIAEAFATHDGQIFILKDIKAPHIPFVPKKARFVFKEHNPTLKTGDIISFKGHLYGPQAYQAQRFFYQELEAQGKVTQLLTHIPAEPCFLENLRHTIMRRLQHHLTPTQAQIAIPLIVGEQRVVSSEIYEIFRRAGIAHVLSVSGFHMALLAGFVFFLIQGVLSLFPYIAVRISTKKVAAIIAFFVTGLYLLISGLQVPAIRSFMMISLVFLGIVVDRKTLSLDTLLLVAFCILFLRPEWITSVSFQLSFTAVLVLVGLFEDVSRHLTHMRFIHIILAALLANVLITLALAPFVIYHFNQLNLYGVLGNLATGVLFSFFVMPLLFIATLLMPFHLETYILKIVGLILDFVTHIAQWIANLSGSEILISSFSGSGLALISFGIVLLCIIKQRMRLLGFVFIFLGLICGYFLKEKPNIIVLNKAKTLLIQKTDGTFAIQGRESKWLTSRLLRQNGQTHADSFSDHFVKTDKYKIALDPTTCDNADLAILSKPDPRCQAKDVFIPKYKIPYEIYLKDSIRIQREDWQNRHRPWSLNFKRKEKHEKK